MIELIDTHCHIQSIGAKTGEKVTSDIWSKQQDLNIDQVVKEALDNGVTRSLAVGCNLEDSKLAINTASNYSNIWATIGIHPHEAKDYLDNKIQTEFSLLADKARVVAVGECGLDYYYQHSSPDDQKKVLEFQLQLATKRHLPVIFHVREAFKDFWPIVDNFKEIKGVVHSFTDNMTNMNEAIKRGLFIGVNGIATFTKNVEQTDVYKAIPLENLLLETDSPFLTPVPLRGSINTPKNVRLVAEYLANLKGQSLQTISEQTTANAIKLFNL